MADFHSFKTIDVGKITGGLSFGKIESGKKEVSRVMKQNFYLGVVVNGKALFVTQKRTYSVSQGDLFVLTPSMSVSVRLNEPGCCMECVRISPEFFDTLYDGQLAYNQLMGFFSETVLPIVRTDVRQYEYLRKTFSLFGELVEGFTLNPEGIIRHLCSFYLLQVANVLYKESGHKSETYVTRSNEVFRRFKKLVMKYYRTQHNLSFYANELHISTAYLSRTVKSVTGRTVHFMIAELIYTDAVKYLVSTDMDVKEIAEILGFSDQSSFGKFFLKRAKVSPQKFRQRSSSVLAP